MTATSPVRSPRDGLARVRIEDVWPVIDAGRSSIARVPGDLVEVFADILADGTAEVSGEVRWARVGKPTWRASPMSPIGQDRFRGGFEPDAPGRYVYTVAGWVDPWLTWRTLFERQVAAGTAREVDLQEGGALLLRRAHAARGEGRLLFQAAAPTLTDASLRWEARVRAALAPALRRGALDHPDRQHVTLFRPELPLRVDPPRAGHGAWYEVFPRSTSPEAGRSGTFRDLIGRLPYIADLGFDVVYLPPIHPIGRTHRKGPDNRETASEGDPGSPWAIGGPEGGHTSVHPDLGTLQDFRDLLAKAQQLGLEVALDLAFQCSPDHPWVREHPSWFRHLPDGTIRTAENPPKRYQDIFPLDFETEDWRDLWEGLRGIVDFWVDQGVRWFRVDNPHTKPLPFWDWLIAEVRGRHPEVLFLAEAFTRPKVMYALAKVGFTHSYTYFTWRTTKTELTSYFSELERGPPKEFFRPHLWPTTPDILPVHLHGGGPRAFGARLLLAATLSSHFGIYGPTFEKALDLPLEAGKEEYLRSEKYERKLWSDPAGPLPDLIRAINRVRRASPALTRGRRFSFHGIDNDRLIAFSRRTENRSDEVLVVVNLEPSQTQAGRTFLDLGELGLSPENSFQVEDLLNGPSYRWEGASNFVELRADGPVGHIFRVTPGEGTRHPKEG